MRKAIMISVGVLCSAAPSAAMAETFPVRGTYEGVSTYAGQELPFRQSVNASTKEDFKHFILLAVAGSNCRELQFGIGNGSFRFTATCDTPDRDIRGIKILATGNYTSSYFSFSNTFSVLGKPAVQTVTARLVKPR